MRIHRVCKLCLPRDALGLMATGRGSWTEVLEGTEDRLRGEEAAWEGWESSQGWCPQRASKPAEQPPRVLDCDSALPSNPNHHKPWTSTPLQAGGLGFRIWFLYRNHVWRLVLSPGHRGPPRLVSQSGGIAGARAQALTTAPHSHPASLLTGLRASGWHPEEQWRERVLRRCLRWRLRTGVLGRPWARSVSCQVR